MFSKPNEVIETKDYWIHHLVLGSFATNCYVLVCKATNACAVIDVAEQADDIHRFLKSRSLDPSYILITHAHIDHVHGCKRLKALYPKAVLALHKDDYALAANLGGQSRRFGFVPVEMPAVELDLSTKHEIELGRLRLELIHSPGHSPGHVCFYLKEQKTIFSGDLLFRHSIGRSDFEGGDAVVLKKSLDALCERLADDVLVLPGHGEFTSIGSEKRENPFL
ncbi:MAG: MBL fold metallo-hydrolase [Bradymonadales bacterium]|jgi:hydroxyacylglutathione hydrolase